MAAKYKHRCVRCKKNFIIVTYREKFPVCYDCQKNELKGEIKDPKMKKLLNIPEEYYKENSFLRSIKVNYLRYGGLSDRQIEAFKKTVEDMSKA